MRGPSNKSFLTHKQQSSACDVVRKVKATGSMIAESMPGERVGRIATEMKLIPIEVTVFMIVLYNKIYAVQVFHDFIHCLERDFAVHRSIIFLVVLIDLPLI